MAVGISDSWHAVVSEETAGARFRRRLVFEGMVLHGAVIQLDDDANKSVYGKKNVAADLAESRLFVSAITVVQPFLWALQKYAPGEMPKTTQKQ